MLPLKSAAILTVTSAEAGKVHILCCSYMCHYEGDADYPDILKHVAFLDKEIWFIIMCYSIYG